MKKKKKNVEEKIKEISKNYGFLNYFIASAKDGTNVDESMKYLLEYIIEKMVNFCNESGLEFGQKRKDSVRLKDVRKPIRSAENLRIPATNLAQYCYNRMFEDCSAMSIGPKELPATTLVANCYRGMFGGCSSLTQSPYLPALTLVSNCYNTMFQNCSSLAKITAMFTTTPTTSYCRNWVQNVPSSGVFVKNTAANWNVTGAYGVPSGWSIQTAAPQ